jgi:hypothetical protein
MSLKDDKQQNIQMELDFSSALTGAARGVAGEETESLMATNEPENPARTNRLMEEVCERENLKEALRQVKGNKGSAGMDGVTVDQLTDGAGSFYPAGGDAGSAAAVGSDFLRIQLWFSTGTVSSSSGSSGATVYRCGLQLGGRSRLGKVFRSSQSRQIDGTGG